MSFPRYPSYKDSGVEWLGDVPTEWDVKRLKHGADKKKFAIVDGPFGTQLKAEDYRETGVPLIRITNLNYDGKFDQKDLAYIDLEKANEVRRSSVIRGDVVVGKTGATIGKSALIKGFDYGIIASSCLKISPCPEILKSEFLLYSIVSDGFLKTLINTSGGSTRDTINIEPFANLSIAIPSLREQQTIAAFLDRETAKIDALIAEQQRLIELLKEIRQAVISHAVTKGLNPNSPMKDSGIEWLGEVPEHWEICAIKRMTILITDGAHISPETEGGVYDFISTKDISDKGIDFEGCLKTSPSSYEYLVRTGCQPICGDILFSKDGTIGRTVVIKEQRNFVVASSLIIIRPDSDILESSYFNYLCQSSVVVQQVESFVKGAGLPRLSIQNLLKVMGVFPLFVEQQSIVTFLDNETDKLDTLTAEAQTAITLLQERRTVLISAAVTGKIDVRGLVIISSAL